MRLIDADRLESYIEEQFEGCTVYDEPPNEVVSDFQSMVDDQPTVYNNIRHIVIKNDKTSYDALYDYSRQLVYINAVSVEAVLQGGFTLEEDNE